MTRQEAPPAGLGPVVGWVGDRAIPRELLDRRIAELRDGPLAGALPVPGSSEDRQLARWLAQVILTEALCEDEAAARGLAPVGGGPLDRVAAVELGSINASAFNGSPWVRAVFEDVTAAVGVPPEWRRRPPDAPPGRPIADPHAIRPPRPAEASAREPRPSHEARATAPPEEAAERFAVWHGLFGDRARAEAATARDLEPLGVVTLGSLPTAIADALRAAPEGTRAGPVEDSLGWHVATARPEPVPSPERSGDHRTLPAPVPPWERAGDSPEGAARRRAFARWLDQKRAERIRLVPGLEHPGDPRQPDNHHKH
ncbi:DUF7158 domain-containing protein [Nonomuraea cavernae]|uniref:PpiC domain-containing protein n=1 Tax=Nonomuraea cavernae TaxID=2045107 RepID=A0A918DMJ3_9ACTN|nr:hypothetical protein [Nonomuraea cavernae]MCA2188726.1 hypothetical protein [Nonomuraea cavernae]GGO74164.1 hypothetical protein GCM10012289_46170 [Nonomuraea cavernae]